MVPIIVQDDIATAQMTYDLTLIVTLVLALLFLPFLAVLVVVQTQNFMLNQTTNSRFSKHRRSGVNEAQLAALAGSDSSYDDDYSAVNSAKTPNSMRSREGSVNEHSASSPMMDCRRIFLRNRVLENARQNFKKCDQLHFRFISSSELAAVMNNLGENLTQEEASDGST